MAMSDAEIFAQGISYGRGSDCDCCPGWVKDENSGVCFSIDEARDLAHALLAAAKKAEEAL